MNSQNHTLEHASSDSILARNKVLRQTYTLLGANILFSALCSYIGIAMHIGQIPFLIALPAFFILCFAVQKNRNSGLGIVFLFTLTGFLGLYIANTLGFYFSNDASSAVVKSLAGTAIIFFGLSAYVLTTGKNFAFLGGFLFVGVMVTFLVAIGAIIFDMTALSLATSAVFLLLFSGYVLYDTSKIIHGQETNYIIATLNLFINIFNIFISLLNLTSLSD